MAHRLNYTVIQNAEFAVSKARRVGFFQYRTGLGRVLKSRIAGGLGRVGVLKYSIGYFRVSYLFSGISGYFG